MPSMIEFPSGRLPEKAPRLDLMGTEASGGRKVYLWFSSVLREYLGIYRPKNRVRRVAVGPQARGGRGGGARPIPWPRPYGLSPHGGSPTLVSKLGTFLLVQEKSFQRFYSVWTPFNIPYLQYSKTRKKQKLALGTRLIG